MNIEKIKNYNVKMQAVVYTMLVFLGAVAVIAVLWLLADELMPRRTNSNDNNLLSDERVEQLTKDSLRQQIISFDEARLVDTAKLVYVIPIKVKTLESPEAVEGVLDMFESPSAMRSTKFRKRSYYHRSFCNLIVYDAVNKTSGMINNERFVGENLSFSYYDDDILLVYEAVLSDTNKDAEVSSQDLKSLFVYSLNNRKLQKVGKDDSSVKEYHFVYDTKDLLVTFGQDRNGDGEINYQTEPTSILRYNYADNKLESLIDEQLLSEIQTIIDKPNK